MLPRGIRNNNPLNIRRSKDKWKGMSAQQQDALPLRSVTAFYIKCKQKPKISCNLFGGFAKILYFCSRNQ